MSHLLDTNVLLAAGWKSHVNHAKANTWLQNNSSFATCSLAQSGFIRVSLGPGINAGFADAQTALAQIVGMAGHRFVTDDVEAASLPSVSGYKEVMDAHFVMLAQRHGLKLATLDKPLSVKPWAAGIAEYIG